MPRQQNRYDTFYPSKNKYDKNVTHNDRKEKCVKNVPGPNVIQMYNKHMRRVGLQAVCLEVTKSHANKEIVSQTILPPTNHSLMHAWTLCKGALPRARKISKFMPFRLKHALLVK